MSEQDLNDIFGGADFDTHSVEPQGDFLVIPPGKYPVSIERAEIKQTKAKNGHYIELEMAILDGEYKNLKLWDRINIDNPSEKCVQIGLRCLAALGQALNIEKLSSCLQLVNGSLVAHVKVKSDGQNEQNDIRTYSSLENFNPPSEQQGTPPDGPPLGNSNKPTGTPPWQQPQS